MLASALWLVLARCSVDRMLYLCYRDGDVGRSALGLPGSGLDLNQHVQKSEYSWRRDFKWLAIVWRTTNANSGRTQIILFVTAH